MTDFRTPRQVQDEPAALAASLKEQAKAKALNSGNVIHHVKFPFVRDAYSGPVDDGEGFADEAPTWKPGTRFEAGDYDGCGDYEDGEWQADGEGLMVLEVLGVYKPGKYPERTFYLRRFMDPDGKEFGKHKVRVIATNAFKRMAKGYRHAYELPAREVAP